jgi:colanic acid biosynthesis glycosyl transferase WcaI
MNILFLSHYFPPEVNAPASRTFEHCRRWVAAGHRVTVITCAPNCPTGKVFAPYRNRLRQVEMMDGIRVVRVWTLVARNKGTLRRTLNYLSFMLSAVLHGLFERHVDVVVATSPQFFCGWAGVLLTWLRRKPFVLEIRDIWPESIYAVGALKRSRSLAFLELMERTMYRAADRIVTVGDGYKARIVARGVDAGVVEVVMNGVDPAAFSPAAAAEVAAARSRWGAGDRFVVSYVGTVGMAHGLEVVLDAAERLQSAGRDDVVFWIVGDGARRAELERQAKERGLTGVRFTGIVPRSQVAAVLGASDACLVHLRPSALFESVVPSKIFECMAVGVPIIMGVVGEARSWVLEAGAGVVMEPGSAAALVAGIDAVRGRGRAAFAGGREYVTRRFLRDVLAARMLAVLESVA